MSLVSWLTPWKPATMTIEPSSSAERSRPGRDVDDPRLAVAAGGDDAGLRPGEGARLVAVRGDGDRQQRHRDALAGGEQHVELAAGRVVGDLAGLVEQFVGGVAHRGDHDDDVVTVLLRADDPLGDTLHVLCGRDGGTAVLLDDEGHGSTGYRGPAADPAVASRTGAGCDHRMDDPEAWLLSADERGNPHTTLPAWTTGNLVEPLVHGTTYFDRLVDEVRSLNAGRPPVLHRLARRSRTSGCAPDGPTVAELFTEAVKRGVCVRGLVWRSHMQQHVAEQGVQPRPGPRDRARRRRGDPRPADPPHGQPPPEVRRPPARRGPVEGRRLRRRHRPLLLPPRRRRARRRPAGAADGRGLRADAAVARRAADAPRARRSACSTPCSGSGGTTRTLPTRTTRSPGSTTSCTTPGCTPTRCRRSCPPPPECGPHLVQTLRTYPAIRPPYAFAPDGERSVARGYTKAIKRARRLIYLEDQYMWSAEVARLFADALRDAPRAAPGGRRAPGPRPGRRVRAAARS